MTIVTLTISTTDELYNKENNSKASTNFPNSKQTEMSSRMLIVFTCISLLIFTICVTEYQSVKEISLHIY